VHRRKELAYGRWDNGRTAVGPVLQHIAALNAAGVSTRALATRTGVGVTSLQTMKGRRGRGPRQWVTKELAAAVLAVQVPGAADVPAMIPGRALVDATGTRRRAQALMAIGYTQTDILGRIGRAYAVGYRLWHSRQQQVHAETAEKVAAIYDELAMTTPPDSWVTRRARRHASRRGWAPPLAWDDDTIDDPAAAPAPWQRGAEPQNDWIDHVVECREFGWTDERIAASLGLQVESLGRRFDRAGLPRDYGRPGVVA
jgi:hypothetical protein